MLIKRPAFLIALVTGTLASGVAFLSGADAVDSRAEGAPIRVATAVFAGGSFLSAEADLDGIEGVLDTVPGYTGGGLQRPGYRQVAAGGTGHYEAIKVTYDPARISYDKLAAAFLRTIDPTDDEGQFCDRGEAYRTAIFVSSESERNGAVAAVSTAQRVLGEEVVTEIRPLTTFWPAEDSYQDYYLKNRTRYAAERKACGRDARVWDLWGQPSDLTN